MATVTTGKIEGRTLVSDELFGRLVRRIAADHPELAPDMPARIMSQALAFLATCATSTAPLGPSDLVDIGWHTFILYTRDYAAFCDQIAGQFIHHEPDDGGPGDGTEWPTIPPQLGTPLSRAVAAMTVAGYAVDEPLWWANAAKCSSKCSSKQVLKQMPPVPRRLPQQPDPLICRHPSGPGRTLQAYHLGPRPS